MHGRPAASTGAGGVRVLASAVAVAVLVLLGATGPTVVHDAHSASFRPAVGLDHPGASAYVVRVGRHLPTQLPAQPLQPAAGLPPGVATPVLLLVAWLPVWVLSRRSRQAHLLMSAGRGPPSAS